MSEAGGRARRRAVHLSEVDRKRLDRGEVPTWLDPEGEPRVDDAPGGAGEGGNDQRILAELPPHFLPRP